MISGICFRLAIILAIGAVLILSVDKYGNFDGYVLLVGVIVTVLVLLGAEAKDGRQELRSDQYNLDAIIADYHLQPKKKEIDNQDKYRDDEITVEVESLFGITTYRAYQYSYMPPDKPAYEKYLK